MFAVTYCIGLSSGSNTLVGLYTTKEKAENGIKRDMKVNGMRLESKYSIEKIATDKEINITYCEW